MTDHPHIDTPAVQANWIDGKHPKGCTGNCNLCLAGGIIVCGSCGWDDVEDRVIDTTKK